MNIGFLSESIDEKEERLRLLNEIEVERSLLNKQLRSLDAQTKEITDADSDYMQYIKRCHKSEGCFSSLGYEKYYSFLKLFVESPPESDLYVKLAELLKVNLQE